MTVATAALRPSPVRLVAHHGTGVASTNSSDAPQLLQRTFLVLSLFTPEQQEWTVTELGRACNLAVPTVHRILTALHHEGYLVRDDMTKRFRLGPTVLRMGRTAALAVDMRSLAVPLLRQLAAQTAHTALLTVLTDDHRSAVCLERVESSEPLRLSVAPGRKLPLHAGASAKILLAHLPEDEREDYLSGGLDRLCRSTITDPDVLHGELDRIKERGWACSYEETNPGVWGLSVSLLDETGGSAASLGIAGPSERKPRNIKPWLVALMNAAASLAEPLGLTPSIRLTKSVNAHASTRPDPSNA